MRNIKGKLKRKRRIRTKVFGVNKRPRLSVFRSANHTRGQIIDDEKGTTLISAGDMDLPKEQNKTKKDMAKLAGDLLAKRAKKLKIKKVVFDRGGNKYHGRVKAFAEGARDGGLIF